MFKKIVFGGVAAGFGFAFIAVDDLYTAFVLMNLWDWFVAPAFHLSPISFWMMFGLTLAVRVLLHEADWESLSEHQREQKIEAMVDACVPESQRESVDKKLKEIEGPLWLHVMQFFSTALRNTFALGIGFVVHMLTS